MPARILASFSALLIASSPAAAESRQPAYVVDLPAHVGSVFVADTGDATLLRFETTSDGLVLRDRSYMSIGQHGVGKARAWDRKTPLGIYFVVDQLDTRGLHEKYGVTAFPLDYPSVWDRHQGRSGDGIWVHGVLEGGGKRPPLDTDGCLALPNDALRSLEAHFVPLTTPVIVTREVDWVAAGALATLRDDLDDALQRWRMAIGAADADAYLALYADDFRYRGLGRSEWAAFRRGAIVEQGAVDASIIDRILLADPEEEGLYLARFLLRTRGADGTTTVLKRLYWRRDGTGSLRIVAEDNG
ncbi:MAG: L,D-transpeptidase family protein [Woeseiaceae bacterium]|nr:L,D-transpeptidase family protein [Woeseiaceae bacterium]